MKKSRMSGFNLRAHLGDARLKVTIVVLMTFFTWVPFFTAMAQEEGQEEDSFMLEEIVVSSSRIAHEGFEAPTPTTVLASESLQYQGLTNVADLINQSPAFRQSETAASRNHGLGGSNVGNYVNMRGLGTERTLVLMNGNRIVSTSTTGSTDLNLIPTIAIARTDVVTGGASAAWGSDAVAGVVNLITKRGYEGLELEARGGQTIESDNETGSFSVLYGQEWNDTTSLLFAAEYEDSAGGGYIPSRDWSDRMVGHIEGPETGSIVIVPDLQMVGVMTPGGHLLGPPPLGGQNFSADGQSVAPPVNPGIRYAGGPKQSGGDYHLSYPVGLVQLTNPVTRYSALASVQTEFSDTLRGALELNYGYSASDFNSVPYLGTQNLYPDNPYLPQKVVDYIGHRPFQTVGKIGTEGMPAYRLDRDNKTFRMSANIEGELTNDWAWDAHYSYGQNDLYEELGNNVLSYVNADQDLFPMSQSPLNLAVDAVLDAEGNIVCRSGAPGCVPFNYLGIGTYSQEAFDYITGTSWRKVKTKQHNFGVNVKGDLGSTPAGPIAFAAGYEYRVDEISGTSDEQSQNNLFDTFNRQPVEGDLDVNEGYVEVLVPLLSDKPFAVALDLNAAVRHAEYELAGGATTWKVGATYKVSNELRLRASTSRDIRAPNLQEVFQAGQTGQTGSLTGFIGYPNETLIHRHISGNPDLIPEESDTVSFGVSYRPGFLPGFSVGADYYDIEITNAINFISADELVYGCVAGNEAYCANVDFNADDPTGRTINLIREMPLNIGTVVTRGVDIELGYEFSALDGEFALRALGAYVAEVRDSGSGDYDRAGQISDGVVSLSSYWSPEWVWDTNVRYSRRAFGMNLHSRYIDSGVLDVTAKPGGVNEGKVLSLLSGELKEENSVESIIYVDLAADYTFERNNGMSIQVFAGGKNIFNTDPPEEIGITLMGSSRVGTLYDLLGTSYYAGVRVKF